MNAENNDGPRGKFTLITGGKEHLESQMKTHLQAIQSRTLADESGHLSAQVTFCSEIFNSPYGSKTQAFSLSAGLLVPEAVDDPDISLLNWATPTAPGDRYCVADLRRAADDLMRNFPQLEVDFKENPGRVVYIVRMPRR